MVETRRVKMTKKCLKQALLELLSVKSKDKISISEICNLADVNRSTFYAYYNDLSELLSEIENDVISQLPLTLGDIEHDDEFLLSVTKLFESVKSYDMAFRVLIFHSDNDDFAQKLCDYLFKRLNGNLDGKNLLERYRVLYRIRGAIGLVKTWIKENFPIPPDEFAKMTIQIAMKTK